MNILLQLAIVFGVCLISEVISAMLPFALPASIIGMLLLLLMLILKMFCTWLVRNLVAAILRWKKKQTIAGSSLRPCLLRSRKKSISLSS